MNKWTLYKRQKPNRNDHFKNMTKNTIVYYGQVETFINAQDEFIEYLESKIENIKKELEK